MEKLFNEDDSIFNFIHLDLLEINETLKHYKNNTIEDYIIKK